MPKKLVRSSGARRLVTVLAAKDQDPHLLSIGGVGVGDRVGSDPSPKNGVPHAGAMDPTLRLLEWAKW